MGCSEQQTQVGQHGRAAPNTEAHGGVLGGQPHRRELTRMRRNSAVCCPSRQIKKSGRTLARLHFSPGRPFLCLPSAPAAVIFADNDRFNWRPDIGLSQRALRGSTAAKCSGWLRFNPSNNLHHRGANGFVLKWSKPLASVAHTFSSGIRMAGDRWPRVEVPGKPSCGTSTIRDLIPYEFGGTVELVFASDGIRCHLERPADWLSNNSEPLSESRRIHFPAHWNSSQLG